MVGSTVPHLEPPISPSTTMDSTTVGLVPKAHDPLLWKRPKAASILVDGEIAGSMCGTIYPTISASQNGGKTNDPSGWNDNYRGRIIAQPSVDEFGSWSAKLAAIPPFQAVCL